MQERIYDLEKSLKSSVNVNGTLSKRLQETELIVKRLKELNQLNEQQSVTRESLVSIQLTELVEELRFSNTEIRKLYQLKEDLENKVKAYMDLEKRHHQESRELRKTCEALNNELLLAKNRLHDLGEQAIPSKGKKVESSLRETEKTLEIAEPSVILHFKDSEVELTYTETKLKTTEAKLKMTRNCIGTLKAEGMMHLTLLLS